MRKFIRYILPLGLVIVSILLVSIMAGIAMVVLVSISLADALYFEAALLIAMAGFVGTVAWCKFVTRGSIID